MKKIAGAAALLCCALAQAQSDAPFHGTWAVTWVGDRQTSYEARLVLGARGGTWQTSVRSKNNPCVGREVPVKVDSMTAQEAQLTLAFSETIPGCRDSKVTLRATPDGVAGTRGDAPLTLKRQ